MMIDVDHFKLFNDNYGHLEGDQCLRVIADTLAAAATQNGDFVARYGGEEFVVLLPDTDLAAALETAARLRHTVAALAIAHRFAPCGHVTVSIGVAALTPSAAFAPGTANSPEDLLGAADGSLYAAKRGGRNTICAAQDALMPAA
jgi:diguanylate cyclase (GGDEF)-like protein